MNTILFLLLFCVSSTTWANEAVIGQWRFSSLIYRGQNLPLLNPDLKMIWSFSEDGISHLYWDRGTADFCERWAKYKINNAQIEQEVYAVNPNNAPDCARDPDMQIGKKTKTHFELVNQDLHLFFQLGDEELIYVLSHFSQAE